MLGRKLHLIIVGVLTLVSLSLSLITEVPRVYSKAPEIALITTIFDRELILNDRQLLWMKVCGIMFIVTVTVFVQYRQVYKPFMKFDDLRMGAFNQVFGPELDKLRRTVSGDLHFSIMRRVSYVKLSRFIQIGRLNQIYHYGFSNEDRDRSLTYWFVKLFGYEHTEGIAAAAFLHERALIVDLRDPSSLAGHLRGRKLALNRELKLMMSFPVIKWQGTNYRCLGVVNVDIRNDAVATQVFEERPMRRLEKLAQYFQDCTEYVSLWL